MRTIEAITPIANIRPEVLDIFDDDAIVRELAEINGMPAKTLNSKEIVAQMREARAQQQQEQMDLQNAEVASNSAMNMARAAKEAQAAGLPVVA
jgi:hypothetical protein